MDFLIAVVLSGVVGIALSCVWWNRRARRVYVIDHVRVKMHAACVIEDRVVEIVWRAAITMTNTSLRPRVLPVFAERATVRAGRRTYLGSVYLESYVSEISPGETVVAWLEGTLPAPSIQGVELLQLRPRNRNRRLRWAGIHPSPGRPQFVG